MEFPPPQEFRGDVESHPPQDGYARGQRAGRSNRSTMDLPGAATEMAPSILQLISPSSLYDQERMTRMTRTLAEQVAADIPDDVLSRDPQQHDLAAQQILICGLWWL